LKVFSSFEGFLEFEPTSALAWHTISSDSEEPFQVSIGRFSSKIFGKRRKRRKATFRDVLKAFQARARAKIGFCGNTGLFQGIIVVIASQNTTMVSTEPPGSAQQRLLGFEPSDTIQFAPIQFAESNFRASGPFNFCIIQFADSRVLSIRALVLPFNFCFALSLNSVLALLLNSVFALSVNSDFETLSQFVAILFELFGSPLLPPHIQISVIQFRHSF
jgi:hypothetical protein